MDGYRYIGLLLIFVVVKFNGSIDRFIKDEGSESADIGMYPKQYGKKIITRA